MGSKSGPDARQTISWDTRDTAPLPSSYFDVCTDPRRPSRYRTSDSDRYVKLSRNLHHGRSRGTFIQTLLKNPSTSLAVQVYMSLLSGRVVCITGSSRGIGRGCAIECAKHGATGLILHYFGDTETTAEILSLSQEISTKYPGAKVRVVPGDIGDSVTSKNVCMMCGCNLLLMLTLCFSGCRGGRQSLWTYR